MATVRYPILRSRIPRTFYGRHLTRTECQALRQCGHACSERWIVTQEHGQDWIGIVFKPCRTGGYDATGIRLQIQH